MENSHGGPPTEPWRDLVYDDGNGQRPTSLGRRSVPPPNSNVSSIRRDVRAEKEEAALEDGFEYSAKVNDHKRTQSAKAFVHCAALVAVVVIGIGFFAFGLVWMLHYLMPVRWRWLSHDELAILDRVILHGLSFISGGVLTKFIGKHI